VIDMACSPENQALLGHSSKPATEPKILKVLRGFELEM
jgi:hypothetical protein